MRQRTFGVVAAALVVAATTPVVLAAPAQATAYRYWTYWHVTGGEWKFSPVGATGYRPDDGEVEAWHFAISAGTASAPKPRTDPAGAFATICGNTPAVSGKKRVALVVDFGTTAEAPPGQHPPTTSIHVSCLSLAPSASGWDTLIQAGYQIRSDDGLICGLSGYPRSGCGAVVVAPAPTSAAPVTSGGAKAPGGSNGHAAGAHSSATAQPNPRGSATAASLAASASASESAAARESSSASARAKPSTTGAASGSATESAPTLVEGAPAGDASGTSKNPLLALLALVVIAGIGTAALVRRRRSA